jgi:hypothetical protein
MEVEKTTSPEVSFDAPKPLPKKKVPSSNTRTAFLLLLELSSGNKALYYL